MLGNFSNVTKFDKNQANPELKISSYFLDSERNASEYYDLRKSDVFSLGTTLMNAFYLHTPISKKVCAPFNRKLVETYPIMEILMMMTK
jgi:hypothetical protein